MKEDILLKTALFGFDRQSVMDYIERLQSENRELKDYIAVLERTLDEPSIQTAKKKAAAKTAAAVKAEPEAPIAPPEEEIAETTVPERNRNLSDSAADSLLADIQEILGTGPSELTEEVTAAEEPAEEPPVEEPEQEPEEEEKAEVIKIEEPDTDEEQYETKVAAAMNKADAAIAQSEMLAGDNLQALYEALLNAVSNSDEIQLEYEEKEEKTAAPKAEKTTEPAKAPVKVKVKIHPKKID